MSQISHTFKTVGVIVGRDLVGDALVKLPFLRALRNACPGAEIHWISTHGPTAFSDLLRQATRNLINVVEDRPSWLGAGAVPYFDLLIDTRNRWREAKIARAWPHGLFLALAWHYIMSERYLPLRLMLRPPAHLCDRLIALVATAVGYTPPSTGALTLSPELQAIARQILPLGQTYIGLAPGAGYKGKVWPRYKFEQIAAHLAATGKVPVFMLGPQELSWYDELVAISPTAKFPLQDYDAWGTAQLNIDHTLAVASLLDVAVANDSGVGHMLAAADCPLISLFGPTSAAKLAPRVSRGMVIRAQDFGDSGAMTAIPVKAVDQAITKLLLQLR